MSKKDPRTGCPVMTTKEFFQMEAEKEGKGRTDYEVMLDVINDMEADEADMVNFMSVPENACKAICDAIDEQAPHIEDVVEKPAKVLKVLYCRYSHSMHGYYTNMRVEAERPDGTIGHIVLDDSYDSGSYDEPPYSETNVYWEGEDHE